MIIGEVFLMENKIFKMATGMLIILLFRNVDFTGIAN